MTTHSLCANLGQFMNVRLSELPDFLFDPTVVSATGHGHRYSDRWNGTTRQREKESGERERECVCVRGEREREREWREKE
jgi:hypothetical protein